MKTKKTVYQLPDLPYGYDQLAPYLSQGQLEIHHRKHHLAYVNGANNLLAKLEEAREKGREIEMKSVLKELSFHLSGHLLHKAFWENLQPPKKGTNRPEGALGKKLVKDFGSFKQFEKEFSQTAASVEGSGWAALVWEKASGKLFNMQIEKHNLFYYPNVEILLVLDVWEHAYYLDYQNERPKFIEAFWNLVNWDEVGKRFSRG